MLKVSFSARTVNMYLGCISTTFLLADNINMSYIEMHAFGLQK